MDENGLVCYRRIYSDWALKVLKEIGSIDPNEPVRFASAYIPGHGQYGFNFPDLLDDASKKAWAKDMLRSTLPHFSEAYRVFIEEGGREGFSIYRER
jgi:hypothetical protein